MMSLSVTDGERPVCCKPAQPATLAAHIAAKNITRTVVISLRQRVCGAVSGRPSTVFMAQ